YFRRALVEKYQFKLLRSLLIFFLNWYDNIRKKHQYERSYSLMKKSLCLFVSVLIILIIGGCGLMEKDVAEMDPKDLPDVRAFQDDFTREFMTSIEPVEDGYYEFESKTGGYTMKFPENATMSNKYYERKQKNFERLRYAENESKTSNAYVAIVTYDHFSEERETKRSLNLLSKSENYNGDYKEFKNN